jgi:hypothetical protein
MVQIENPPFARLLAQNPGRNQDVWRVCWDAVYAETRPTSKRVLKR